VFEVDGHETDRVLVEVDGRATESILAGGDQAQVQALYSSDMPVSEPV